MKLRIRKYHPLSKVKIPISLYPYLVLHDRIHGSVNFPLTKVLSDYGVKICWDADDEKDIRRFKDDFLNKKEMLPLFMGINEALDKDIESVLSKL